MKRRDLISWAVVLMVILSVSGVAAESRVRVRPESWSRPLMGTGLDNAWRVDEGVYRSGQPDDDAFKALYAFGVREVLNLREYHSDDDEAKGIPLALHRIPIRTGKLSFEELLQALTIIKDRKGPILIHCWHGSDRTGAVVAAYRLTFQGWTHEAVLDEMVHGGYGHHGLIYGNLEELIASFDVTEARRRLK